MRRLTKDAIEHLRSGVEAHRVGQDDPIPFDVANLGQRVDYFRKLVRRLSRIMSSTAFINEPWASTRG